MFEDVMDYYKLMSISDKRKEILNEIKLVVAVLEKLCVDNNIEYRKIKSREILDFDNGFELEKDYLEALFVYVQYLKEVTGSLLLDKGGE